MSKRTVLVVEDEPLIRMMLADVLDDHGFRVLEAGTVIEAVAVLQNHHVDAVITDIDMPGGLSGLDLARFVQSRKQGMPFIVTSGGHVIRDTMLPGRARFIAKPYRLEAMLALLNQELESRQGQHPAIHATRAA